MRVLGDPKRVEAALFERCSEVRGRHRIIREENRSAYFHIVSSPTRPVPHRPSAALECGALSGGATLARLLMSSLFVWDGIVQLRNPGGTAQYFASVHVPAPDIAVW